MKKFLFSLTSLCLFSLTAADFNGSFEEPGKWEIRLHNGAEGYMKRVPGGSHGKTALKVVKTNAKGFIQIVSSTPVTATGKKVMQFGGKYRTDSSYFDTLLLFRLSGSKDNKDFIYDDKRDRGWGLMAESFFRALPPGEWARRIMHRYFEKEEKVHLNIIVSGNPAEILLDELTFMQPEYTRHHEIPRPCVYYDYSEEEVKDALARRPEEVWLVKDGQLLCNGKPALPVICKQEHYLRDFQLNRYAAFSGAGIKLMHRPIPLSRMKDDYGVVKAPGVYDFATIDRCLMHTLRQAPDARIIIEFEINEPYPHWEKDHPDEVWKDDKGNIAYGTWSNISGFVPELSKVKLTGDAARNRFHAWAYPSYSSKTYRDVHTRSLKDITAYLMKSPFRKAIVGFMVSGGHDFQFQYARTDHSAPATADFRAFLKDKFKDINSLNREIKSKYKSFDEINVPPFSRGEDSAYPVIGNSLVSCWYEFRAGMSWNVKHLFADAIKSAADKPVFVSAYGNPPMFFPDTGSRHAAGKGVDIFADQGGYGQRLPGYPFSWKTSSAYKNSGRIHLLECDLRTWTYPVSGEIYDHWVGVALNEKMWQSVNRKYAGAALAQNMAWWYLSMNRYFDAPEVMKEIRLTTEAAKQVQNAPEIPFKSGVCMIRDERSMYLVSAEQSTLMDRPNSPLHVMQFEISGVPYDLHSQDDFAAGKVSEEYQVYCFVHNFRMSEAAKQRIERLKKLGKTLVFVYSPGYKNTRFKLNKLPGYNRVRGELVKNHPLAADVRPLTSSIELFMDSLSLLGSSPHYARYQAMKITGAKKSEVLSRYKDGSVAAAAGKDGDATIIVLAEPFSLSAGLLANIARYANAYTLCEPGLLAIHFNGKFLSCHAVRNGKATLTLPPGTTQVEELLTENGSVNLPVNDGKVTLQITAGTTRWFLLKK